MKKIFCSIITIMLCSILVNSCKQTPSDSSESITIDTLFVDVDSSYTEDTLELN